MAISKMNIDGRAVDYLDSRTSPGGEMGAMDVIEQTRRPSILKTSEGEYICWMNGHTAGGRYSSLSEAQRVMGSLLG